MGELEITIDTEEIAHYLFNQLVQRGYAPQQEEVDEVADVLFDYLIEKCVIDEEI
ncbi:YozD family protein [Bacillus carboniphilus]|uniref:YozD family protein n=1 Tax=Bacillus carboniphilus TaxID=86663 RepID=A0ABY9JX20_9BACI|nr:YozD family protein [Bacillus carboniphilus]WLR43328.1 YozD family protein [Bacillus carboniphilus]